MKKILIALLITPLLMAPMLSFSVVAEDTPPLTTSNSDNVPDVPDVPNVPNDNKMCQINPVPCLIVK